MNNKEFIAKLSVDFGASTRDTTQLLNALVGEIASQLEEENIVSVSGFGVFDVKKKLERVVVNPATKQRMLVPPKMVINFKPTTSLKDRANNK